MEIALTILSFIVKHWKAFLIGLSIAVLAWQQHRIDNFKKDLKDAEALTELQRSVIENQQKDFNEIWQVNQGFQSMQEDHKKEVDALRQKFQKKQRNFSNVSYKKPKLVQNLMNKASDKRMKCLERVANEKGSVDCSID